MALPRGTTGSLCPTFVSARLVGLAVRQAYAIALNERFPTALSPPSRASVTLWEATAPVKLPTMHCPGTGWRRGFKAYYLFYTCRDECQCKATVKVHGVFPSDRRDPASSRGIQFH